MEVSQQGHDLSSCNFSLVRMASSAISKRSDW
jgi:hypothetical protein